MTNAYGNPITGEEAKIEEAVNLGAEGGYDGIVTFKDGRPPLEGAIWVNAQRHEKDFAIEAEPDNLTSVSYGEVASIQLGSPLGPPPTQ